MRFSNGLIASALVAFASAAQSSKSLTQLLKSNSQLTGLYEILQNYPSIANSLSNATNVTLFAPNNNAISNLRKSGLITLADSTAVTALLDYHVAQGKIYASDITSTPQFCPTLLNNTMYSNVTGGQVVEAQLIKNMTVSLTSGLKAVSNVTQANLNFTGGVVHVIDQVLTIPSSVEDTALAANLTSLVGALQKANLTTTVEDLSDITIFAPLNSAFEAVANVVGNVSTKTLTSVLEYHVVKGNVYYSTMLSNTSVKSLEGSKLNIKVEDDAVFVNAARVVNANILIGNGVMHIIDSVLNPNDMASPKPSATTAIVQFSSASEATSVPFTSGVTATTTVTNLVKTTDYVASGNAAGNAQATGKNGGSSSSSGVGAVATGAIGAAALFGGAAVFANL